MEKKTKTHKQRRLENMNCDLGIYSISCLITTRHIESGKRIMYELQKE